MDKFEEIKKKIKDLFGTKSANDNSVIRGMLEAAVKKMEREKDRYKAIPSIIRTTKTLNTIISDLENDIRSIENEINGNSDLFKSMYVNEANINDELEYDNSTITMAFLTKSKDLDSVQMISFSKDKDIEKIKAEKAKMYADFNAEKVRLLTDINNKTLETTNLKNEMETIKSEKAKIEADFNIEKLTLTTDIDNKTIEITNLKNEIVTVKAEKAKIEADFNAEKIRLTTDIDNKTLEIADLNQRLKICKDVLEKMKIKQKEHLDQISDLKKQLDECRSSLGPSQEKNREYDEFLAAAKKKIEEQNREIDLFVLDVNNLKRKLEYKTNELMQKNTDCSDMTIERNLWNNKYDALFEENKQLKIDLDAVNNQLETKMKMLQNIRRKNEELGNPLNLPNNDKTTGAGKGEECLIQ